MPIAAPAAGGLGPVRGRGLAVPLAADADPSGRARRPRPVRRHDPGDPRGPEPLLHEPLQQSGRPGLHLQDLAEEAQLHARGADQQFQPKSTTLLDDGDHLWIHWGGERLTLLTDTEKSYEEARSNVYLKEASRAGNDSICDRIALLGTAWLGLILDPSLFHRYPDPLEPYIDGIQEPRRQSSAGRRV